MMQGFSWPGSAAGEPIMKERALLQMCLSRAVVRKHQACCI